MTKEERIQKEWTEAIGIENYSIAEKYINKEGWINCKWHQFGFLLNTNFLERKGNGSNQELSRPKSLQGIENNRGWIKIESEDDLPKGDIDCFWMDKKEGIITGKYILKGSNKFILQNASHYQPIQKPEPPLY